MIGAAFVVLAGIAPLVVVLVSPPRPALVPAAAPGGGPGARTAAEARQTERVDAGLDDEATILREAESDPRNWHRAPEAR